MASQDVGRRLPPVPVESTFTTLSANVMAGNNVTPGYVHEALDRSSTCDTVNHVVRVSAGDDECSADCCTTPSHNDALDGAYGMEPNALLWALKNFWFGVEEDMTEFAYKVCIMALPGAVGWSAVSSDEDSTSYDECCEVDSTAPQPCHRHSQTSKRLRACCRCMTSSAQMALHL